MDGETDLFAADILHAVFHRYVVVRSGWEWEIPFKPTDFRPNSVFGNIAAAMGWILDGRVSVDGLHAMVSPNGAQTAYGSLLNGTAERLGIVFDWSRLQT